VDVFQAHTLHFLLLLLICAKWTRGNSVRNAHRWYLHVHRCSSSSTISVGMNYRRRQGTFVEVIYRRSYILLASQRDLWYITSTTFAWSTLLWFSKAPLLPGILVEPLFWPSWPPHNLCNAACFTTTQHRRIDVHITRFASSTSFRNCPNSRQAWK